MRKCLIGAILFFSILGIVAAVYSALAHYDTASSAFCVINETFNCDVVNKGPYSELFGIPVSIFGLGAYSFLLVTTLMYISRREEAAITAMSAFALAGLVYSLYLTYIEAFVIFTWCILCITSQISILIIAVALLWLRHIDHIKPRLEMIHDSQS
ncbi:MAG: vitamin K epoxide reductase family protein [bacterium]